MRHFHPAMTELLQQPELIKMYFKEKSPPSTAKQNTTHLEGQCFINNRYGSLEISMVHSGIESSVYHAYFRPDTQQTEAPSRFTTTDAATTAFKPYYPEGSNTSLPPYLHTNYHHPAIQNSWDFVLLPAGYQDQ
jgi:hypothetical protein